MKGRSAMRVDEWEPMRLGNRFIEPWRRLGEAMARRQVNWTIADQVAVSGSNFAITIIAARLLGLHDFGVFSLAIIVVQMAQSIATASVSSAMMNIGPRLDQAERLGYYAASFRQTIVVTLALALVVGLLTRHAGTLGLGDAAAQLVLPVIAATLSGQLHDFLRRYCFTAGEARQAAFADSVRSVVQLGALATMLVLAPGEAPPATAIWALAIGSAAGVLSFGGSIIVLARTSPMRSALSRNFRFSRWLVGAAVLQWAAGNLPVIATGAILGPAAAGALRAGQALIGVINIALQALDNIVPPHAARLFRQAGREAVKRFAYALLFWGSLGVIGIGLLTALPGEFWLRLVFGPHYAPFAWVLGPLAVSYVFIMSNFALRYSLLALEQSAPIFWSYVTGSVVALAASYPLVSGFGLAGALAGLIAVQAAMLVSLVISFQRHFANESDRA